jgi:hypothetical protein
MCTSRFFCEGKNAESIYSDALKNNCTQMLLGIGIISQGPVSAGRSITATRQSSSLLLNSSSACGDIASTCAQQSHSALASQGGHGLGMVRPHAQMVW